MMANLLFNELINLSLVLFYLGRFINKLKTNVRSLLGLGPNTTEITGKVIETVSLEINFC